MRLAAAELIEAGASDREIAQAVPGVADVGEPVAAVPGRGGRDALASKGAGGANASSPRRRSPSSKRSWMPGPAAAGYADQCWTLARVAEQAWQRFGVEYTLAGTAVLLHPIGWSVQVPARRAAGAMRSKIARWREDTWPVIKGRRRTWAPGPAGKMSPARG